jgi:hypothetical protein
MKTGAKWMIAEQPVVYKGSCYACPFECEAGDPTAVNMALIRHECLNEPSFPHWEKWLADKAAA